MGGRHSLHFSNISVCNSSVGNGSNGGVGNGNSGVGKGNGSVGNGGVTVTVRVVSIFLKCNFAMGGTKSFHTPKQTHIGGNKKFSHPKENSQSYNNRLF